MKTNRQFLLWCVVVLMFCAALSIGCGGSSTNNDNNNDPTQDQGSPPTDDSTGRNESWESLMSFKEFSGAWEIYTINMAVNRNTVFDPDETAITRFRLTATPNEDGGYLETSTLDGREFGEMSLTFRNEIYGVLEDIVILSSGSYEYTNRGALFRTKTYNGRYCELEGAVDFSTSELVLPLQYIYFRNYYNYDGSQGNDKYVVQTVLHRIPDDTVEGLGLVAGNWKIVSASLQVNGSTRDYALYDWNDDFNPNVTLIPKDDMLAWSYDTNPNYSPLTLVFMDDRFRSTIVNLLEPLNIYDYKMVTPTVIETPRTDTSGNSVDFQQITGSDSVPWSKIKISRVHYSKTVAGQADSSYIVTAELQRRQ